MQLFNGLNMGIIKFYGLKFDSPEAGGVGNGSETYENSKNEQLIKIKNEIAELTDGENKDNDKIEIKGMLTTEFANYLKGNKAVADALNNAVQKIEYDKLDTDNKNAVNNLKNFLEPIVNESFSVIYKISEFNNMSQPDGEIGKFANGVDEASEGQESAVGKLLSNINTKFSSYESILNDSSNKDIKTTLEKVKMVLENPVEGNVKILQKVIYDNLNENDKHKFLLENKNKKNYSENDMFDGKFGKHMVEWTQKGLNIIENNLKILKNAQDVISENEKNNILGKVKTNIVADANSDPKNWFDNLPEGAEVKFKDDSEKGKLSTVGDDTEITLIVTANGRSEEITVKVKVVEENTVTTTPEVTKPAAPEKITVNEEEHSIATGSPADKFKGGTLYSLNAGATENQETQNNTLDINRDREYLMKMGENVYKVKIDQSGNLCPIMEENKPEGKRILIKNNESCVNYLLNKLPPTLRGSSVKIMWDGEDYVIGKDGYKKWLTIEPMTIDGKWLSGGGESKTSLADSLAFLNFTNFLRNEGEIYGVEFRNNHPDLRMHDNELYVRVNKNSNKKLSKEKGEEKGELGWKWQRVNLNSFGLPTLDSPAFQNFIKYNNGEDWNDNWDKKSKNKGYVKIDFPNVSAQVAVSAPASELGNSSASELSNSVVSSDDLHSSGVAQSVVEGSSVDQSGVKLNEVVVMSTIFKPKNPIVGVGAGENEWDIGSKKDANFDGLGKFENGKFTFDAAVIGNDGKMSVDKKIYDRVNINNGIFVDGDKKAFTGEGYYLGDIIRDKDNSGKNNIKYLYYGNYKDGLRSGQGTMVFDNDAKYEGEWKEGNEEGNGKYTYTNGDIYEGAFVDGKFEGNGTFTFKDSGIVVSGKFEDNKFVSGNVALNGESYQVERDEKGLKITSEGNNKGKYLDVKNGSVIDVPVNGSETKKNPTEQASAKQPAVSIEQPVISAKRREQMNQDPENVTQYGFSWTRCQNKESLGIPSGKNVYKKGNDGYFYFKDGDNFVGINPSKPYLKIKTNYAGRTGNKEFNICNAGVDKLNTLLEGIPGSKFEISSDRKNYVLSWDGNGRQTIMTLEEVSSKGNILNIIYGKTKDHYSGKWENNNLREGTFTEGGINYKGKWEKNKIIECTSYGNTIKINYDSDGKGYFQTRNGKKLYLNYLNTGTKEPYGKAANTINRIINIVKYSRFKLDQFEEDGGKLQADYEKYVWDTDLLSETSVYNAGFQVKPLVDWLNEYRKDVGI